MKSIYTLFAALLLLILGSCKDERVPEDLLRNINYTPPVLGENRYLYQEVTSSDTIAEYRYAGRRLVQVKGEKSLLTITYAGDQMASMTLNQKFASGDSIAVVKDLVYNLTGTGKLDRINETAVHVIPAATAGASPTVINTRSSYDITYGNTKKPTVILKKSGIFQVGQPVVLTSYERWRLSYGAQESNATQLIYDLGTLNGTTLTPVSTVLYEYGGFDTKRSPYTLLPMEYRIHRLIDNSSADKAIVVSDNTPTDLRITGTGYIVPYTYKNTGLAYDPLNFLTAGWNRTFVYKPF